MGNRASREAPAAAPSTSAPAAADTASAAAQEQPTCPVPERYRSAAVYNVYNQRIAGPGAAPAAARPAWGGAADLLDPKNNMPLEANQQPCPGQRKLLSTERVQSTIPKGGTDSTWTYPSPQMFFNALRRKGKGDDVAEDDMEGVVHAHNTMNEITWQRVQAWEALHAGECPGGASLLRFRGRPDDLSPLAWLRAWLGGPLPFDRHDWYVDRCGREVRYVIDFYFDDDAAGSPDAFSITVRPALDSPEAALDRVKMAIYERFAEWGLPCPVTGAKSGSSSQAGGSQQQQQPSPAA
eukprot:scaffold20.g7666.t1